MSENNPENNFQSGSTISQSISSVNPNIPFISSMFKHTEIIKWQTTTPVKFESLSRHMIKLICNGCGGKGEFIKPPHNIFFKTSCDKHDYSYIQGGNIKDKEIADLGLYKAMKSDCLQLGFFSKLRYRSWCWLYYQAVKTFGHKYFRFSSKKRWPVIIGLKSN